MLSSEKQHLNFALASLRSLFFSNLKISGESICIFLPWMKKFAHKCFIFAQVGGLCACKQVVTLMKDIGQNPCVSFEEEPLKIGRIFFLFQKFCLLTIKKERLKGKTFSSFTVYIIEVQTSGWPCIFVVKFLYWVYCCMFVIQWPWQNERWPDYVAFSKCFLRMSLLALTWSDNSFFRIKCTNIYQLQALGSPTFYWRNET